MAGLIVDLVAIDGSVLVRTVLGVSGFVVAVEAAGPEDGCVPEVFRCLDDMYVVTCLAAVVGMETTPPGGCPPPAVPPPSREPTPLKLRLALTGCVLAPTPSHVLKGANATDLLLVLPPFIPLRPFDPFGLPLAC